MATTNSLKRLLHKKQWELCTPSIGHAAAVNTAAGSFVVSDKFNILPSKSAFFASSASTIYRYDGDDDAWITIPASGATGTFAAGSCGEFRGLGAMGGVFTQTATAGGATSITTNRTIVANLAGSRIRVIAGTGVGFDGTIVSNTIGANAVITTSGGTFDATTQYQIYSGSLWFFNAGTTAVGFSVYDIATNAWTAKSVTNLPTAFGTAGRLVSTLGAASSFATGTSTGTNTTTTLNNTGKNWRVNGWANYQVRITAGTGIGQIRTIASNTATALTVSAAWTVTPDATSVYSIEGNDDFMYLMGNGAVTLYKYVVSTNTWSTLAPTAARAAAAGAGFGANWIDSVSTWTLSGTENASTLDQAGLLFKQNGRYIFSFRGGASSALDAYDIAANTWVSTINYGNIAETFTTGSDFADLNGVVYCQKEATSRFFKLDLSVMRMFPLSSHPYPQGAVLEGSKMFLLPYVDGATVIPILYTQLHTQNYLVRQIVF